MSQYAQLGSALTPARVPFYSASFQPPVVPNPAPRFGPEGSRTRYCPTYNGARSRHGLQMDEPPVPKRDLLLPRHSKKNSVSYCGWMEKHTGMTNDWSRRWFSLEAGTLSYYYDKSDRVPKASIPLSSYTVPLHEELFGMNVWCAGS